MIMRGKPESGALPRVWLEINKERLRSNVEVIAKFAAPLKVMAVLKADAYGLGVEAIATILNDTSVECFAVAEVCKALEIKPLGKPVHILGGLIDEDIPFVVRDGLVAPITDLRVAQILSREAQYRGRDALGQLKIDTGMGRLGIPLQEAYETALKVAELPRLKLVGIYSHFPHAYADLEFSRRQTLAFVELIAKLEQAGISVPLRHIANSDGIHNVREALQPPFTMVRTGINLYGAYDPEGERRFKVEPVFELKSRLVAVRRLDQGSTIGYGCTYTTPRPMLIGTAAIGYADGMPLNLGSGGTVLVRGKRCPIIGRVSMDFATLSLEDVPDAQVGDEVVCLNDDIRVAEWARFKGSISYEVICSFGSRVERRYV